MAIDEGAAGWAVLPCCIRQSQYLGESCAVHLSNEEVRHTVLCGAMAREYNAQLVEEIDGRITNRRIFIAGGVGQQQLQKVKEVENIKNNVYGEDELRNAAKRRVMPRLLYH